MTLRNSILFLVANICSASPGWALTNLDIHGGKAPSNFIINHRAELEKVCQCSITVKLSGGDVAVQALNSDFIAGAVVGFPKDVIFKIVEKKAKISIKPEDFSEVKLSKKNVLFLLNPGNPTKALTFEQTKKILEGKITNWESVNGMKEPIKIILNTISPGASDAVARKYLNGEEPKGEILKVTTDDGFLKRIELEKGAFAIAPEPVSSATFTPKSIQSDAAVEIILISKKPLKPEMQKIFDYYSKKK